MLERIKTALVLVAIVFTCLFATSNPIPMILLMTIGGVISAFEWAKLVPNMRNNFIFIAFAVLANSTTFFVAGLSVYFWIFSVAIWLFAAVWVKLYPKNVGLWFSKELLTYAGIVLIVATMSSMFYLWQQSPWWLLYAMLLVWCADTGAYFAGRAFGRYKLAPTVSPKKTYEGLVGGLLLCLLVIVVVSKQIHIGEVKVAGFIVLSMMAAGISVLGDLLESMIKRQAGVKDSGTLLPGHGGLLDRIDSMMATLPVFALGFMALGLS